MKKVLNLTSISELYKIINRMHLSEVALNKLSIRYCEFVPAIIWRIPNGSASPLVVLLPAFPTLATCCLVWFCGSLHSYIKSKCTEKIYPSATTPVFLVNSQIEGFCGTSTYILRYTYRIKT